MQWSRFKPSRTFSRVMMAAGVLSLCASFAGAQSSTDWSAIRDALHADGVVQPGNILSFDLVRQDLAVTISGKPVSSGEVANGYVHFKALGNGAYYVNGSLPTEQWLTTQVAAALRASPQINVTAVVNHTAKEAPALLWVHFEATGTSAQLLPAIVKALARIKNPQIGVTVTPVDLSSFIPARFQPFFAKGATDQVNDVFALVAPRPDEASFHLGSQTASPFLGVGESFYLQLLTSDTSQINFNAEFALRANEVQPVMNALRAGGFNVPALHDHFMDDTNRLFFVHAYASGTSQALTTQYENALFRALGLIYGTGK